MTWIKDGLSAPRQKRKMQSRKLWVAGITAGAMFLCGMLKIDLSPVQCAAIVAPAVAYILGESFADGLGGDHLDNAPLWRGQSATPEAATQEK